MTIDEIEIAEPPGKMEWIKLDDSDDESSVCLPSDLENFEGNILAIKALKSVCWWTTQYQEM